MIIPRKEGLEKKVPVYAVPALKHLPFVSRKNCTGGDVCINQSRSNGSRMSALSWKPFVYGGLASITAECGKAPLWPAARSAVWNLGLQFFAFGVSAVQVQKCKLMT